VSASSTSNNQPDNESDPNKSGESRLDRELAEILSRTGSNLPPIPAEPISITKYRQKLRPTRSSASMDWSKQGRQVLDVITAVPLLTALALGVLCAMVGNSSQLLAELFALAAIVVLLAPIVTRMRSGRGSNEPKLWRGQVMNSSPMQENPLDQVKRWFQSRPPRR
jgi:hypothetical protein